MKFKTYLGELLKGRGNNTQLVLFCAVFALIGVITLLLTSAATSSNTIEPESGLISGNVSVVRDASASNGSSVLFKATTGASCPINQVGTPPNCSYPTNGAYAYITSNFNTSQYIDTNQGIPNSSASDPTGNFRLICGYSHLAYDDPIVYPGQIGASPHLHMFFGNTLTNGNSTYQSLRTSGDGTCQGGPLNRTAYWAPALFNGNGKILAPDFVTVYYKDGIAARTRTPVSVFPAGFKLIAGQKSDASLSADNTHFEWYCEKTQLTKTQTIPTNCPAGERVGVHLEFPTCWDGSHLDSADHRSHMSYYSYGDDGKPHCPSGFAGSLPQISLGFWYTQDTNVATWYLSSDRMSGMPVRPNGSSFHSDWLGAWDPVVQEKFTRVCINGLLNCAGGQLGDGTVLKQLFADAGNPYTGPKVLDIPARP